jgi:predicted esterase
MRSKSWLRRFALACGVISLFSPTVAAQSPAIALIDPADAAQWEAWANDAGWRVIAGAPAKTPDTRIQALTAAVREAIGSSSVDAAQVYLAGRGPAAAAVFYAISRVPDVWAAAIAIDGSPQPAIDTNRIFTANFKHVPVLWVSNLDSDEALAAKLKTTGLNVEWRSTNSVNPSAILEWLKQHRRDEFPDEIDCETNSPSFASCYWIQMTKFDAAERNDVLPSTALRGGSGASLDLGGFGYATGDPGPGLLVNFLPEKYSGPLKMGDRILTLDGKPIENARQYAEQMSKVTEEKTVALMVQRGKQRQRIETRIVLPRRDTFVTARVQGRYMLTDKEIQVVSRTVKEMKVTVPPQWAADSKLYWNGLALEKIVSAGCYLLTMEKEILHAARCQ